MECRIRLILEREDQRLVLSEESCYRLISAKGIDASDAEVMITPFASRDGGEYRGARSDSRRIEILFQVLSSSLDDNHRLKLIGSFVPGQIWDLFVDRSAGERRISGVVAKVDCEQESLAAPLFVRLTLLCPHPWFEGAEEVLWTNDQTAPLISFPLTAVENGGVTAGYRASANEITVNNRGDLAAGVVIKIMPIGAKGINPVICCGEEKIEVLATVKKNELLEVSTVEGDKYVRVMGQDVPFKRSAQFFSLPKGESTISVTFSEGEGRMAGSVHFKPKYTCA